MLLQPALGHTQASAGVLQYGLEQIPPHLHACREGDRDGDRDGDGVRERDSVDELIDD